MERGRKTNITEQMPDKHYIKKGDQGQHQQW